MSAACCVVPSTLYNFARPWAHCCFPYQYLLSICLVRLVGLSVVFMEMAAELSTKMGIVYLAISSRDASDWHQKYLNCILLTWNNCIVSKRRQDSPRHKCDCSRIYVSLAWRSSHTWNVHFRHRATGHDETHANLGIVVLIRIGINGIYSNTTIGSGIPFRDTTLGLFPFLGHRRQEGSNQSGFGLVTC